MSLSQASWSERVAVLAALSMSACGGKVGYDPSGPQGSSDAPAQVGGTSATGGTGVRPLGGARPVTGGTRSLGGSPATGGRASPPSGGVMSTSPAVGGAKTSGGLSSAGGNPEAGGSQFTGGTHSNTTGGSVATEDVCVMPPSAGNCDAYFPSYYFNPFHARCEPFVYGGCGGNANRFDTLQACEQRCTQVACPIIVPPSSPIWVCPQTAACYYQLTTGCRCLARDGACSTDSTCTESDAGAEESAGSPVAADGEVTPLPTVLCTCDASQWACRVIDLLPG